VKRKYVRVEGPYILHSEVEKAIKEMRDMKATGDDDHADVPGDVFKSSGLKLVTLLIISIYKTGDWSNDFICVAVVALRKKPKASEHCYHQPHRTNSKD
jgi:hypothetical protein